MRLPCNAIGSAVLAAAGAFLCFSLAPAAALAEVSSPVLRINAAAASTPITVRHLRGNVSLLTGSGGNIAVLNGPNGKLLGDGGIAVSRPRLEEALARLGPAPVRYVINTHYHWDHTEGNTWLAEAGGTIVAHTNTLKRLKMHSRVIEWGYTFPPTPKAGLPTEVFKTERTIRFEGETIVLRHYGSGHTDTDVAIYFQEADILQIGDIWWNGNYPFLDNGGGGSIDGLIRWVNACIDATTDRTIIIPGHGDVGNRAELIRFRDMLVAVRAGIARLKKQGMTLAETVAARPTAAFDDRYGKFLIDPAFFVQMIYMGV